MPINFVIHIGPVAMQDAGYHCDKLFNRHVCHCRVGHTLTHTRFHTKKGNKKEYVRPPKGYEPYTSRSRRALAAGRQAPCTA